MKEFYFMFGVVFFVGVLETGLSIQCYECNSHRDSRCADVKPPDELKKDCTASEKGHKHTMCRKIVQEVEFAVNGLPPDKRTIRTCGWDESKYKGQCYSRGGFGGKQEVCSCFGDFCNVANRPGFTILTILSASIFIMYTSFCS